MKLFDKQEYNKMCAEFLGWKLTDNDLVFNSFINGVSSSTTFKGYIRKEQKYTRGVPLLVVRGNKREIEYYREKEMDFTSDWNWIMEVVEKIEQTHVTDSYSRLGDGDKHEFNIWNKTTTEICGRGDTKKEAVVQAIWNFLNWHQEQSKPQTT